MIKKLLSILLIIMICGCSNRISLNQQLSDLGYSEDEISIINKYKYEDTFLFYKSYNKKLVSIISDSRCDKDKVSLYLKYYKEYDVDLLFKLINSEYLTENNYKYVRSLVHDKFFISENVDNYFKYQKEIDDVHHLVGYVNSNAYKEDYVDYVKSKIDSPLNVLANKWNFLDSYEPKDLVAVDNKYGLNRYNQELRKETYEAFIKMYDAAKKDNVSMYITSAYRGYDYQVSVYNGYLRKDSQEKVDTYSSRPGHSDHQTGNAVDILSNKYDFDTFESSDAFKWLNANAYKYGFILRFPKGKEDITGYMYESWHYRYVGEEVAKYIKNNNLTYEEYYAYFIERNKTING